MGKAKEILEGSETLPETIETGSVEIEEPVIELDSNTDETMVEEPAFVVSEEETAEVIPPEVVVVEEEIPDETNPGVDEFAVKVNDQWLKSWIPYRLCDSISDASKSSLDVATGYASAIKLRMRILAEVVKV